MEQLQHADNILWSNLLVCILIIRRYSKIMVTKELTIPPEPTTNFIRENALRLSGLGPFYDDRIAQSRCNFYSYLVLPYHGSESFEVLK